MRRVMFAVAAFVLTSTLVATAEDPKPAQPAPKVAQPKVLPAQPAQPLPARPVAVTAARMAQLEEDFEALEAHRDVKKAHVKAAEVGVRAAEIGLERVTKLAANNAVSKEEVDKAKVELELAKVQVEIRVAELKEVEVKMKHAKKRLDDAKLGGVRPLPGLRPVPVDPAPPQVRFVADEKDRIIAELKAKLDKLALEAEKKAAEAKKTEAELKAAEVELQRILEIAKLGRIAAGTIEKAEAKVAETKAQAEKIAKDRKALDAEIEALKRKLKEIEK